MQNDTVTMIQHICFYLKIISHFCVACYSPKTNILPCTAQSSSINSIEAKFCLWPKKKNNEMEVY